MATILLLGTNTALLEGLSQTLASAGHRGLHARSLPEALQLAAAEPPLMVVMDRASANADALRLPLEAGGARVVYDLDRRTTEPLPPGIARATLAQLVLPLERQRLLALVQRVAERRAATGRSRTAGGQEEVAEL